MAISESCGRGAIKASFVLPLLSVEAQESLLSGTSRLFRIPRAFPAPGLHVFWGILRRELTGPAPYGKVPAAVTGAAAFTAACLSLRDARALMRRTS